MGDTYKVLVTGGAGLLGYHLCTKLLQQGKKVICLDNFSSSSKHNIKNLLNNQNFTLLDCDIEKPIDIEVKEIYNMACPASPVAYQKDPIKTIKTSVLGSINMSELAIKYNAKILQASTSEVYGEAEIHPQVESYRGNVNIVGERSCYTESKRLSETIITEYSKKYNMDSRIVRIFNAYGSHMDINDGRVISNFIIQALTGKDITIHGDGTQTRSFCYVDDLIEDITGVMNQNEVRGPINIGNDVECSIKSIADKIIKLTNSKSRIVYKELPTDSPVKRKPDLSLVKSVLNNLKPKVDIEEGLIKTIEYFSKTIL